MTSRSTARGTEPLVLRSGAARDGTVAQGQVPLGARRGGFIVSDEHDGSAVAVNHVQQAKDLGTDSGIEVAGWLVGEDDDRMSNQRPRYSDPLLFAAGELSRQVVLSGREANPVQSLLSAWVRFR
jgi:hypothetical protein